MISTSCSGRQSLEGLEALKKDISLSTNEGTLVGLSGKVDGRVYKIAINMHHLDRSKGKIYVEDKKIQGRVIWKSHITSKILFEKKLLENPKSFHFSFKDNPPEFYISSPYFDEMNLTTTENLNKRLIVYEKWTMIFYCDWCNSREGGERCRFFLDIVMASKNNPALKIAAANAISILIREGFSFSGYNLDGIQIPNANLSFGIFEGASLRNADLRNCICYHTNFDGADFDGSNRQGMKIIGERLYTKCEGKIRSLVVSPCGNFLGCSNAEKTFMQVLIGEWREICLFHESVCMALSPQAKMAACAYRDGTVILHRIPEQNADAKTNIHAPDSFVTVIAKLKAPCPNSLKFSADGKYLCALSQSQGVIIWELKQDKQVITPTPITLSAEYPDAIKVAFSPVKAELILIVSKDTVRIMDLSTCQFVIEKSFPLPLADAWFSRNGNALLVSIDQFIVIFKDLKDRKDHYCSRVEEVVWADYLEDKMELQLLLRSGLLLNYVHGELKSRFQTNLGKINVVADYLEQNQYILVGNDQNEVHGIDPNTLLNVELPSYPIKGEIVSIRFSDEGEFAYIFADDSAYKFHLKTRSYITTYPNIHLDNDQINAHFGNGSIVHVGKNKQSIRSESTQEGRIRILDNDTGQVLVDYNGRQKFRQAFLSPKGKYMLAVNENGKDLHAWELIKTDDKFKVKLLWNLPG